jgi:hypothetical protein
LETINSISAEGDSGTISITTSLSAPLKELPVVAHPPHNPEKIAAMSRRNTVLRLVIIKSMEAPFLSY